jgi:diguanylate cyclase (GGDEF)-like protein
VGVWAAILAGTAAVVVAARMPPSWKAQAVVTVTGMSALLSGISVLVVSWRRHRAGARGEWARALIAVAFMMWGCGQFLLAFQIARTGERAFGVADVLAGGAGPVSAIALLGMPRRSRAGRPAVLIGLDAVLLASVVTLTLWWARDLSLAAAAGTVVPSQGMAVFTVFVDVLMAAIPLIVWGREKRPGMLVLAVGCVLQATADITSLGTDITSEAFPVPAGALWCVAWPLMGLGVARLWTEPLNPDQSSALEELGESRMTSVTAVVSVLLLAVVFEYARPSFRFGIGDALFILVVALLVTRELLCNRIRARLIRLLGVEALHDVLTGLPNRRSLTLRLRTLDPMRSWVLLTVDLDNFKEVNYLSGHQAGDRLLVAVADILRDHAPEEGVVARLGGDEFGVIAPGDVVEGRALAERLTSAIRTMARTRWEGLTLSASIGVGRVLPEDPEFIDGAEPLPDGGTNCPQRVPALLDPHHDRLVALVESASALRAAKALGRDHVMVYPGEVERACERRLVLEWRLREALGEGLLDMHAQPLVDLGTGRIRGFESLARWTDEVLGPVSPAEFVPVAEQTGLIIALGNFALRATLDRACALGLAGRDVEIGVNVSPVQLRMPGFASRVTDLVSETGVAPGQLTLEITEAILVSEDDASSDALAELADAGIKLAIDDFGTGYSALGYLRRLPVDILKIDRSWVVDSVTDTRTRNIVSGVIDLAHQLGAAVVMEGIEDERTASLCRDLGADLGQGWLFGRPAPWDQAAERYLEESGVRAPVVLE